MIEYGCCNRGPSELVENLTHIAMFASPIYHSESLKVPPMVLVAVKKLSLLLGLQTPF